MEFGSLEAKQGTCQPLFGGHLTSTVGRLKLGHDFMPRDKPRQAISNLRLDR